VVHHPAAPLLRTPKNPCQRAPGGSLTLSKTACECNETGKFVPGLGLDPIVAPHPPRLGSWLARTACRRHRNGIQRLFRRPLGLRRIFSRFDSLDVMSSALPRCAPVVEA
jgi:hypothetical protein